VTAIQVACTNKVHDRPMPSDTRHTEYRTWAELAEAAKTDTRAWLFLVEHAPWAAKLLETPVPPTRH
jgi:hypothetical protein